MKYIVSIFLIAFSILLSSCAKDDTNQTQPEKWEFTKLVNAVCSNSGSLMSLDFYQKKGTQWRIVRMEPDDNITFYLTDTITPGNYELPVNNVNAFMTSNAKLFDPASNQMYKAVGLAWFEGDPVEFNTFVPFINEFPEMPAAWNTIDKISAATYSFEQAYDDNSKVPTYVFYDFPHQKYIYYAQKTGTDFVIDGQTLPQLCPTCDLIDWKNIDAVTCTKSSDSYDIYYFFDFDAQKMYVLDRLNKDTNSPSFNFDTNMAIDFSDAFHNKSINQGGDGLSFDFSK